MLFEKGVCRINGIQRLRTVDFVFWEVEQDGETILVSHDLIPNGDQIIESVKQRRIKPINKNLACA